MRSCIWQWKSVNPGLSPRNPQPVRRRFTLNTSFISPTNGWSLDRRIVERTLSDFPEDALFVVYCSGPHCNGADRAAVQLSRLGRKVKKMLGGIHGWHVEGFATSAGEC